MVPVLGIFPCGNVLYANHHAQYAYCNHGKYLRHGYRKKSNLRDAEQTLDLERIRRCGHTILKRLLKLLVHCEASC